MSEADAPAEFAMLPGRGFVNLRLDPGNAKGVALVEEILGRVLPQAANTCTAGKHRSYWLGPDEWLLETDIGEAAGLATELSEALAFHAAVNDVSGAYITLGLTGPGAATVLAKGCTLDLHPREFGPGQCARTGLARATVLLAVNEDNSGYTIIVPGSFSDYLRQWLGWTIWPSGHRQPLRAES